MHMALFPALYHWEIPYFRGLLLSYMDGDNISIFGDDSPGVMQHEWVSSGGGIRRPGEVSVCDAQTSFACDEAALIIIMLFLLRWLTVFI